VSESHASGSLLVGQLGTPNEPLQSVCCRALTCHAVSEWSTADAPCTLNNFSEGQMKLLKGKDQLWSAERCHNIATC